MRGPGSGLTEAKLRQLAGKRSFERGLGYVDAVSGIEFGENWIRASVRDTERYEVEGQPPGTATSSPTPSSTTTPMPLGRRPRPPVPATPSGASSPTTAAPPTPPTPSPSTTAWPAPLTRETGNHAYEQLVSLLLSMRDCHRRLGTPDDFTAYVTDLRAAQKRKRNLIRLMDEHGL